MRGDKMKHYIRFDLENFRLEASGAWFGVTSLCYFAAVVGVIGGIVSLF